MHTRSTRRIASILLLGLAGATLSGCGVSDMLSRERTATFDDAAALADAVSAPWVPADASAITLKTPKDASSGVASILLDSASEPPASCTQAPRKSSPMLTIDGAPDVYSPKAPDVFVCGDWTLMASETGWFGWTPNAEDRAG